MEKGTGRNREKVQNEVREREGRAKQRQKYKVAAMLEREEKTKRLKPEC